MSAPAVYSATTVADLLQAAKKLEVHGWGTGQFWCWKTGKLCIRGAIDTAVYGQVPLTTGPGRRIYSLGPLTEEQKDRADAAENAVKTFIQHFELIEDMGTDPARAYDAVDWNDHECRSADEAVLLLQSAARWLEAGRPDGGERS